MTAKGTFRIHVAALSLLGAIAATVSATGAQAQVSSQMQAQAMAVGQACRTDIGQYCSNVQRGGGRILTCLQGHSGELTPSCRSAMPKAEALKSQAAGANMLPK